MELTDVVEDLKELFARSKQVSNSRGVDPAVITVYCDLTKTDPEEMKPYMDALRQVSNSRGTDTAILACYAHYKVNHQKE